MQYNVVLMINLSVTKVFPYNCAKIMIIDVDLVFMEWFCQQLPVPLQNPSVVGELVQLLDVILVRVRPGAHHHHHHHHHYHTLCI